MRDNNLLRLCLITLERLLHELPEPFLDDIHTEPIDDQVMRRELRFDIQEVIELLEDKIIEKR
jgi:hypothetical protein